MGLFDLQGFVAEGLREEGRKVGREEGRREARAKLAAAAVPQVLDTRGVPLTDAERERITACQDPDTLDQWFHRALTATTAQDVFREE